MNEDKKMKHDENDKEDISSRNKLYGIASMKSNLFRTYNLNTPL